MGILIYVHPSRMFKMMDTFFNIIIGSCQVAAHLICMLLPKLGNKIISKGYCYDYIFLLSMAGF